MWWSPCPSVPGQVEMCLFFLSSVLARLERLREYGRERERKREQQSIGYWHRPLAHQLLGSHACTCAQAQRGASAGQRASSSFLAFQEKACEMSSKKPSKRKFPRSSRASPSLYLLCLAAAPKKVSVLSAPLSDDNVTLMRPCLQPLVLLTSRVLGR